jgi:hypothetical protein
MFGNLYLPNHAERIHDPLIKDVMFGNLYLPNHAEPIHDPLIKDVV